MRWFDKLRMAVRALLRRGTAERDLDEELRFHLEREVARNITAGMSPQEARRAAMMEFGGVEAMKEDCRETRKGNWLHDFVQDLRFGLRMLRKTPGFTSVAVLTLALGIGGNTAIFSVVDAVLLKPLPLRHPEQIVSLWETEAAPGQYPLTAPDYLNWCEQNSTFRDMSLYSWPQTSNVRGPEGARGAIVVKTQANFFDLLGVSPIMGRTFAAGEDQNGGNHVAIVSFGYWKAHLGGDKNALNRTVELDAEPYTVIGVMPAWYKVPGGSDIWIPADMDKTKLLASASHQWHAIGRLKNGITITQASADLHAIAARLEKETPQTNYKVTAILIPMREAVVGHSDKLLWLLFGAVGLVLLIACANVANLLLSRATARCREIAVRSALGAGRGRLTRQLLTEGVLLSLSGGLLGVMVAYSGVSSLSPLLATMVPQPNPIHVDRVSLFFTFGVCLLVGLLFGLVPALQSSEVASAEALKPKSAGSGAGRRLWLRDALVAGQIGLSLTLLIGAGLLLRTFANLRAMDTGVRNENVLTASIRLPETRYKTFDQGSQFFTQLLAELQTLPGVTRAAIATDLPLRPGFTGYIKIPGAQPESMSGPLVQSTSIDGNYFQAFAIPLVAGRYLGQDDQDLMSRFMREFPLAKTEAEGIGIAKKYTFAAVINQTMAQAFWPNKDALGKIFETWCVKFQVVGIVGDVKQRGLQEPVIPETYYPLGWDIGSNPNRPFSIVLQTTQSPELLTEALRSSVQHKDPSLALMGVRTMPQIVDESMVTTQYQTGLLGSMAFVALILAAVGTYGVMSYLVRQRTNEIGIRIALGAARSQIVKMVLRQAGIRVAVGIGIGLLAAVASGRLMTGLLIGVTPLDLPTYVGVAALMSLVALAACYLPVRSAMRVDPMVALRDE